MALYAKSLFAENYVVTSSVVSMSIAHASGSTIFGDTVDDSHTFTGNITASGNVSGSSTSTASFGYFQGITSFAGADGTETLFSGSVASTGSFGKLELPVVHGTLMRVGATQVAAGANVGDAGARYVFNVDHSAPYVGLGILAQSEFPYHMSILNKTYRSDGNFNYGINLNQDNSGNFTIYTPAGKSLMIDTSGNIELMPGTGAAGKGSISGSQYSTGSFGMVTAGGSVLEAADSFSDGTATTISGSSISTGSFGAIQLGNYNEPTTLTITGGNNKDATIRLHNTNNTYGHSIVMNDSDNRAMYFKYHNGNAVGTPYMTFDGYNGNVGIGGAIDPNTDLQVGGYSGARAVTIATGNNEDAELRFHNTNNTIGHSIVFNDETGRSLYFKHHNAQAVGTTYLTINGQTGGMFFNSNITGSGTLHMSGSITTDSHVTASGNISGSSTSTGSFGALSLDGSVNIHGNSAGIGIGTNNPKGQLNIAGDPANTNQPSGVNGAPADAHTALFLSGIGNAAGEKYGIQFGGFTAYSHGGIFGVMDSDAGSTTGDLTFDLRKVTGDSGLTEVLRITHEGEISGSSISTGSFGTIRLDYDNLPTSDPSVKGAVWRDGTDLKISAG